MKKFLMIGLAVISMSACVSKKKYAQLQSEMQAATERAQTALADCEKRSASMQTDLQNRTAELDARNKVASDLQAQIDYLKKTNTNLLDRMSDLSIVSKSGAESIRKSLETLNEQTRYVNNLNNAVQRKDSLNLALVMSLKRSLSDVNDTDIQVEVKKGVVYVSIADKLLFRSGSYDINKPAENVLAKVASVVNDHNELDILVQGHTDNVPISAGTIKDNWDLSVLRATAVARLLSSRFNVKADRVTAAGRGEFEPKDDNATAEGRRVNRRTEIILTPKFDQFFNLLSGSKQGNGR